MERKLEKISQVDCSSVETWRGNLKKPLRWIVVV